MNNTLTLNPVFSVFSWNWKINMRIFLFLGFLSIIFLSAFYVFQAISENNDKYLIKEYEMKLSEVSRQSQNLEINLVEINSLDSIIALTEKFNFEKVEKIHYIKVLNSQMVAK